MTTYKIVRHFADDSRNYTVREGLTLEQAKAHCRDRETSSTTCKNETANKVGKGPWFDAWTEE